LTIHDPDRYDAHLVLKIPVTLWLVLAFQLRHLLLLGITFMPTTGTEITVLRELIRPEYLLADLIALPVAVVAVRRRPEAPDWMRRLWPWGRPLLTASALVYLCLLGWRLLREARPLASVLDDATVLSILLNAAVLAYLARSTLARDLFREFPTRRAGR
jgi:hypothetical protein